MGCGRRVWWFLRGAPECDGRPWRTPDGIEISLLSSIAVRDADGQRGYEIEESKGASLFSDSLRQAARRSTLCDMFWEGPNDPRAELRWCLCKLRELLDRGSRVRVVATRDHVSLDLKGDFVDCVALADALASGLERLSQREPPCFDCRCRAAASSPLAVGGPRHH